MSHSVVGIDVAHRPAIPGRATSFALALFIAVLVCAGCGKAVDGTLSVDLHVEAVSPREVPTRGGVEVTIIGRNFHEAVEVALDGRPLGVVRHDEGRLTFTAPSLSVGRHSLTVKNPGGQSESAAIRCYVEQISFAHGVVPFGNEVEGFLVKDLNGDGFDDVVSFELGTSMELVVYHNVGRGQRFKRGQRIKTDKYEYLLAVGDITGDNKADLITRSGVYLGKEGGGFEQQRIAYSGLSIGDISHAVVADFDGDGKGETAVSPLTQDWIRDIDGNYVGKTHIARIEKGKWTRLRLLDRRLPKDAIARDVDGDGHADLVFLARSIPDDPASLQVTGLYGPDFKKSFAAPGGAPWDKIKYASDFTLEFRHLTSWTTRDLLLVPSGSIGETSGSIWIYPGLKGGQADKPFGEPVLLGRLCGPGSGHGGWARYCPGNVEPPGGWALYEQQAPLVGHCGADELVVAAHEYLGVEGQAVRRAYAGLVDKDGPGLRVQIADLDGDARQDIVYIGKTEQLEVRFGSPHPREFVVGSSVPLPDPGFSTEGVAPVRVWGPASVDSDESPTVMVRGRFPGASVAAAYANRLALLRFGDELSSSKVHDIRVDGFGSHKGAIDDFPHAIAQLASCDIDGDGTDDLVAATRDRQVYPLVFKDGKLAAQAPLSFKFADKNKCPAVLLVGDFDGDGLCDIVYRNREEAAQWKSTSGRYPAASVKRYVFDEEDRRPSTPIYSRYECPGSSPAPPTLPDGVLGFALDVDDQPGSEIVVLDEVFRSDNGKASWGLDLLVYKDNQAGHFVPRRVPLDLKWDFPQSVMADNTIDYRIEQSDSGLRLWVASRALGYQNVQLLRIDVDRQLRVIRAIKTDAVVRTDGEIVLQTGDLNGDGRSDAVLYPAHGRRLRGGDGEVTVVLEQAGDRLEQLKTVRYDEPSFLSSSSTWYWHALRLTDIDGDGLDDILYTNSLYRGKVVLVRNTSK